MRATEAPPISNLTPAQFENLTYDALQALGLKNLVWRTPGADGGRDIEGEWKIVDPTGHETFQKWYIECKRYQASIDWPTVWKKLAHADVQGADIFLLSTNSNPSPDCETEIRQWNADRRRPAVRVWRGYEWSNMLTTFPDIALAYGIGRSPEPHDAVGPISMILTKIVQSAYMAKELGQDFSAALDASAALSELISKRLDELGRFGRFVDEETQNPGMDYPWAKSNDGVSALANDTWDEVSVRAMLSYIRYVAGAVEMNIASATPNNMTVEMTMSKRYCELHNDSEFKTIRRWCRLNIFFSASGAAFEMSKYHDE